MGALALRIVNAFRAAIRRIELVQCQAIGQPRSLLEGADQVMTTAGAAEYLGFSIRTLQAWRVERKGPPYCRPSGSVRYLKTDLIHWLTSQRVTVEAEASLGTRVGG
jgi:hypothetical protein